MKLPRAAWVRRLVPQTLFGRLACLVAVAVVFSHFLALKLMFEVGPRLFGGPGAPGGPGGPGPGPHPPPEGLDVLPTGTCGWMSASA